MSFRHLGLAAIGALATPAMLAAQLPRSTGPINKVPDKNASQIMITAFKSVEKGPNNIGAKAAEEMRNKVDGAFPFKQVYVIPVERINPQLEASQFSTTEALEPHDSKALAGMLRADEYIAGEISKTATGFRSSADLVLTRDINARQPLGVGEAAKIGDALNILVKEMKEARKQLDGEKKCTNAAREGKWAEAKAFALEGIAAYPKATLSRMCLLSVLNASKAPSEEVVKVAGELAALDSRSNVPLRYLADAYRKSNSSDSLVLVLTQMMRNEPKNAELQFQIIEEIAAAKNPGLARPIIDSAVVLNPGDPDLLKLRWRILSAMKDTKAMLEQGQELIRLDTAFADTSYFQRTVIAVANDSQFQQAAAVAAQGAAKFPTNAGIAGLEIQYLQRAGQLQQALDKTNKALASKIAIPNLAARKLLILQEMKSSPAEIIVAAREAIASGDTTAAVRQVMLQQVNVQFSAAQELSKTNAQQAITDLTSMLTTLAYADSVVTGPDLKGNVAFFKGASYFLMSTLKAKFAQEKKDCALIKEAEANLTDAMIALPAGSKFAPTAMQQMMGSAMQLGPQFQQLRQSFPGCK